MNTDSEIHELLEEAKRYTFIKNSFVLAKGRFSKASTGMIAWINACEDFIKTNFGKQSTPWRIFINLDRTYLKGYSESKFESQKEIIISALNACLNTSPIADKKITAAKKEITFTQVFIVHGHQEEAKLKVARFIERLGFESIILHEKASSGNTIIEQIEEYSNVGFGIILYTPCDIGGKQEPGALLKPRARQNVIFEHGYLIGKIGRDKVCALVKGNIETPTDISGVVYTELDDSDAWKIKVAQELKKSGYLVDLNKII